jgi:hypothetical protein
MSILFVSVYEFEARLFKRQEPPSCDSLCPQGDLFRTTFPVSGAKIDKGRVQLIIYDLAVGANYNSLSQNLQEGGAVAASQAHNLQLMSLTGLIAVELQ